MPNQHKSPMLGWHPPAELSAWARVEAERRDVALKVILDEALAQYRERTEYHVKYVQADPAPYAAYETPDGWLAACYNPDCAWSKLFPHEDNDYGWETTWAWNAAAVHWETEHGVNAAPKHPA